MNTKPQNPATGATTSGFGAAPAPTPAPGLGQPSSDARDRADAARLRDELAAYQAEVVAQNDELRVAHAALEAASRRWADVFHQAPAPYMTVGRDGQVRDANAAALELLADGGILRGRALSSLAAPGEVALLSQLVERGWTSEGVARRTVHLTSLSGRSLTVEVSASPLDGSETDEVLVVLRDLTEALRLESERARLTAQVERLQRLDALGRMAGAVAHEVNNMLTVILTTAEAGCERWFGAEAGEYFDEIGGAARRGRELTRRLLGFGRATPSRLQHLAVEPLLSEVAQFLQRLGRGLVDVRLDVAPETPAVKGDPALLHQALLNLGLNALDALGDEGGHVVLRAALDLDPRHRPTGEMPGPGPYVCLTVEDDGPGFTAEALERVFEPFFSTKPAGKGTGLGLPMVYGVARDHHGAAFVSNGRSGGAIAGLVVPAAQEPVQDELPTPSPMRGAAPRTNELGLRGVLVIDDERSVGRALQRVLRMRLRTEVYVAAGGAEGLALLAAESDRIDAVLLDLFMPGMSGLQTLEALRATHPRLPVILLSGFSQERVPAHVLESPATAFLSKPPEPAAVEALLRTLIAHRRP
jgi:PAS domain S-box-containing protein